MIPYEEIVNESGLIVIKIDQNGVITYANRLARELMPQESERVEGKKFFDLFPPETAYINEKQLFAQWVKNADSPEHIPELHTHTPFSPTIIRWRYMPIRSDKEKHQEHLLWTIQSSIRTPVDPGELHFKELIESLDDWIWEIDAKGKLLYTNLSILDILGYDPGEWVGQEVFRLVVPEEIEEVEALFRKLSDAKETIQHIKSRILHKNGHQILIESSAKPILDATGELIGFRGISRDITKNQKLHEQLQETTDKYFALFNQLPEAAWLVDGLTARLLDVNEAATKLYGYSKTEFLQLKISEIDIYDSEETVQANTKKVQEEGFVSFETKHRTKTDEILDVRVSIQPIMIENQPVLSVTCQNLTELKKNESRLKELNRELENKVKARTQELFNINQQLDKAQQIAQLGSWIWDIRSGILTWSDEIYRIFGHHPQEFKATYEAFLEAIHPDDVTLVTEGVQKALENDIPYDVEHRIIRLDGTLRYVREQGSVEWNEAGEAAIMIGTVHDITDYKTVIHELSKTKERLETAQSISHIGNWHRDMDNDLVYWSDEVFRIFECPISDNNLIDFNLFMKKVHPADQKQLAETIQKEISSGKERYGLDYRIKVDDGIIKYIHEEIRVYYKDDGAISYLEGTVQDISRQVRAEQAIVEYNQILDNHVIVSQTDLHGIITHASKAFCTISGYSEEELIGQKHSIIRHQDMPAEVYKEIWDTILSGGTWEGELKNRKKNGRHYWVRSSISPRHDDEGNIIGFTAIREDITDQKRIEELSITDDLTGLFNRRHFNTLFAAELRRARRDGKIFCFFIMDIDHFKRYNDTYGHQKGDEALRKIGSILTATMKRSGDYAFRLGGEEFGGIFTETNAKDAYRFTQKIGTLIEAAGIPHEKNTASSYISASFGLVTVDFSQDKSHEVVTDTIYKIADDKLYEAKAGGRNRVVTTELFA